MSSNGLTYPGNIRVHWPSGPVDCCETHAKKLISVGKAMGFHISSTEVPKDEVENCVNCMNEYYKTRKQ